MLDSSIDEKINLGAIFCQIEIKQQYSKNSLDAPRQMTVA